ncbi:MAG TPA: NADH-quinone oxidoreductase subunit NuoF [bacterium]|nr:NADH-quinone oxidoreductase subunit NuoF [bacterium]
MAFEKVLTRNVGHPEALGVRGYRDRGGYDALARALRMAPEEVVEEVKRSGLRGRGGAGFPCGMKWSFVPRQHPKPKYIVCNADESEPGTFKDRLLMENDPHQLLEGCVIAGWAVGANTTYIYIRGEYTKAARILEEAVRDAYASGVLGENVLGTGFRHDIHVHRGAGAYICGEETGLLESLEGKRGWPRLKPPFPAIVGAFKSPTVVNNVETLANLPLIINRGAAWFAAIGPDAKNTGPKLYCVSGHVNRPGLYEFPMGKNLKELIYDDCGGIRGGKKLKAVIPGGSSVPVLRADQIDVRMDFESLAAAGSMLGSAGVIVMDEETCMVNALYNLERFYAHESCGKCTPCREGTAWMAKILKRLEMGGGRSKDLPLLEDIARHINFRTICPLGDAAAMPAASFLKQFRDEFAAHAELGHCPQRK